MTVTSGERPVRRPLRRRDPPGPPAASEPAGAHYRPFLDGLRSVAVYLVVLFHAGSDTFAGGYIGVDVFFVLSGYLVTQLLLRDLDGSGSIDLRRFYARRIRRLLPAATVVIVVTALVFSSIASPVEVDGATGGFRAALLYFANWHFIGESAAYFGPDVAENPVLHFWSLSVEEQFYLVWPLLLAAVYFGSRRAAARRPQIVRLTIIAGALASLVWALTIESSDPERAYYGTDARAYQLLAGAALAVSPRLIERLAQRARAAQALAGIGLMALVLSASSAVSLSAIERGLAATSVTAALIVATEAYPAGAVGRALSTGPLVYLGRISYGTYLWHWPVIVVMTRSFELSTVATVALASLIATSLASLSFQLLEHPIRVSTGLDRWRGPVIAGGLSLSVLSALAVIPAIVDSPRPARVDQDQMATDGLTPVPAIDFVALARDYAPLPECYQQPVERCRVVEGSGPHVLLIGDSHAATMVPAFRALAEADDLSLSVATAGGCPWQLDLFVPPIVAFGELISPTDCDARRNDVYDRILPATDPEVVVVMNLAYETPGLPYTYRDREESKAPAGSEAQDAILRETTLRSVERLTAGGARLLVIEPIPLDSEEYNAVECLSAADVVESCRYVVAEEPTSLERLYRRIDEREGDVWVLDLDRVVCPYLPICDPIVGGVPTKMDSSHLSTQFSRSLAPLIGDFLRSNGVLEPRLSS